MRAVKIREAAIGPIIKLVSGDIDRVSNLARAVAAARGIIERPGISIRSKELQSFERRLVKLICREL
jgi:hypothetical protein